jgi:type I restriction enzyme R subunit
LFNGNFSEADRVILFAMHDKLKDDKKLKKVAKSSNQQIFTESIFPKSFDEVAQDNYVEHTEAYASLFQNKSKYKAMMVSLAEMLYREFNSPI